MTKKHQLCLVACSVLKDEIRQLVSKGELDVDCIFVSKYFHVDYVQVEKNLRRVLEKTIPNFSGNVVLVYGDLCLGMNGEMRKLAEEYGIIKVDALNCIDCQLGGKGKFLEVDPDHNLMFLSPGMTEFFNHMKEEMRRQDVDEAELKNLFQGLRGIVLLDTLGKPDVLRDEVEKADTGLAILETWSVGLKNVKNVVEDAIQRHKQK